MDSIRKKKVPRIRNRPRNKTNQLQQHDKPADAKNANEDICNIDKSLRNRFSKEKPLVETLSNKQTNLQKKNFESVNKISIPHLNKKNNNVFKKKSDSPQSLFTGLEMIMQQQEVEISDVSSSNNQEEEYIEYIYQPRSYFLTSLCHFCSGDLRQKLKVPCCRCGLVYYCTTQHMKLNWKDHRTFCNGLQKVSQNNGGNIFRKCGGFSADQFRDYRIIIIRQVESSIDRKLSADEQEVILFPRICNDQSCRECFFKNLLDCKNCGQVAFCKDKPNHLNSRHSRVCSAYSLFQKIVVLNKKFGRLETEMPFEMLNYLPDRCFNINQVFNKLSLKTTEECELALLSQSATIPLTAWFALKLCGQWHKCMQIITIHLIGAEIDFEVYALNKWELFLLHISPCVKELNIVFVGPELNTPGIDFKLLANVKCCQNCQLQSKKVNYYFEPQLYHDYSRNTNYLFPQLICFFNPGLHRNTGFQNDDTWPETIVAASQAFCPIVVTAYTHFEAPLDMMRLLQVSKYPLKVVLPPTINPFKSTKPERNFISDHEEPIIFKNYVCFVVD